MPALFRSVVRKIPTFGQSTKCTTDTNLRTFGSTGTGRTYVLY